MIVFVCRLRKEYRTCNEKLGQTGAGLRFEDIKEGSDLQNLVGACTTPLHCSNASTDITQINFRRNSHIGSASMGFGARCLILILLQLRQSPDKTLQVKPGRLSRAEEHPGPVLLMMSVATMMISLMAMIWPPTMLTLSASKNPYVLLFCFLTFTYLFDLG
jgi:hypothetical protein